MRDAYAKAAQLDAVDPLASQRAHFDIPEGTLYFDGNSLGPLTFQSREALHHTIEYEWRERLIRSWNETWLQMPSRVGNAIAPLIGADANTVICADNTSINLSTLRKVSPRNTASLSLLLRLMKLLVQSPRVLQ